MSTERDIIIERLEQKLAAKDNEIAKMQESLRESIIAEMEKRFADMLKLRESTIDGLGNTKRIDRLELRLIELNSSYDGVMKELLDQKSIIQELTARKVVKEEPIIRKEVKQEVKPIAETKPAEKPKPKNEYIIADNYIPKEKRKQVPIIEAEERTIVAEEKDKVQPKKPPVKKSEKVIEGVEIVETLKRGK